jgi:nucleotide-binding universal stress UspA family protein
MGKEINFMYKQLVVPLDGSLLAEKALPIAVTLLARLRAELVLLRVIKPLHVSHVTYEMDNSVIESSSAYAEKLHSRIAFPEFELAKAYGPVQEFTAYDESEEETAQQYLNAVKAQLVDKYALDPLLIHTKLGYGSTPEEIATIASKTKAELIVMTTHGRTGLSRLVTGSVATKVLKQSKVPVMLIRPDSEGEEPPLLYQHKNRILLTLDGSPESEAIVSPAINFARETGAIVYLLQVVLPFVPSELAAGSYNPSYAIEQDTELAKEMAYKYLEKIQLKFTEAGVNCLKIVRVGTVLEEILDFAKKADISLLAMASHARNTVGYVFLGSIADEIIRMSNLPVLMVHTPQKGKRRTSHHEKVTAS